MAEIRVWDNDKLLSPKEMEEVIETAENLDFDRCKKCIIIHVSINRANVSSTANFNPRFEAFAEADDGTGYFGWHIL